ncbi:hypothetical protein [Sphingorhabdus sp. Alg231-15]|uniref:hypothetical protein n=1 Tax=Sphingorhabdus sp. Alg231-15 TaxID=1922222 RepID=UPI000D55D22F
MNILRTTLAIASLAIAAPSFAQATPESIANSVLVDLKAGDATNVVENLLAKAPLISTGPAEKTNLINTLNTLFSSYGEVEGWELVGSRYASNRYVEQSYIVFQEQYAMSLELKFYRAKDGWNLTAFNFNDKLEEPIAAQFMADLAKSLESPAAKD